MIQHSRLVELSEFLGIELKLLKEMDRNVQQLPGFAKWINIAIEDWVKQNIDQSSREAVEGWFRDNNKYIFELSDVHSQKPKQKIVKQVIALAKKHQAKTFLDYGGGIGEESIQAARAGLIASMADIPSQTFKFAKWRAKKFGVPVKFIAVKSDTPLKAYYESITCFEVLQHLFHPEVVAKHLIDHLVKPGLLILTTRFNNPGYEMVLKKNYKYEEGMVSFLTKQRMELIDKIYQYGEGERAKHIFVYKKR